MTWREEVDEIKKRKNLAEKMGGSEGVAVQHKRGKLTVRERFASLADPGSFHEWGALGGRGIYEDNELTDFVPKAAVNGMLKLNGRKVIVSGGDFTVRGGSGGSAAHGIDDEPGPHTRAREWRLPYIRLLDAAGGSVSSFEQMGRTYLPDGNNWSTIEIELLDLVPVVSAVLGSVAGLPAVQACMAHFNIMVKGISQLFPGGPPVVKASLGYDITKEDLGGEQIHVYKSGVVDNLAETEEEAFEMIRSFLSYLPSSVWEMAPRAEVTDDPARREVSLLSAIPRSTRRGYDPRKILKSVLDLDSFFEIAPYYGQARVTGLGRVNGYPVGVMINNPMRQGGSTDVAAGDKVIRLIQLCELFHLPLVSFADEPGFMVGLESEKQGIERAGARLVAAVCRSRMPWITFVMRQLYGVAGQCQHRPTGMFRRYAWPSANWGSMHIEGGTRAAYKRIIEAADDPSAKEAEVEGKLKALASPFRTAEASGIDIIDPCDTRMLLCEFLEEAQRVLKTQLGPPQMQYRP